jgi:hypothetical protein
MSPKFISSPVLLFTKLARILFVFMDSFDVSEHVTISLELLITEMAIKKFHLMFNLNVNTKLVSSFELLRAQIAGKL